MTRNRVFPLPWTCHLPNKPWNKGPHEVHALLTDPAQRQSCLKDSRSQVWPPRKTTDTCETLICICPNVHWTWGSVRNYLPRHCPIVFIHLQLFERKGNLWQNFCEALLNLSKIQMKYHSTTPCVMTQLAKASNTQTGLLSFKTLMQSSHFVCHLSFALQIDDFILPTSTDRQVLHGIQPFNHHLFQVVRHRIHPLRAGKSEPRW